jgi:hypothetical protein
MNIIQMIELSLILNYASIALILFGIGWAVFDR